MMGQFHSRIMGQTALKITFDSDVAFANKSYEYVSTYHPLINAAMNFFIGKNSIETYPLSTRLRALTKVCYKVFISWGG